MNKQGPNGIGWCDYTWNPIKGLCPVDCKTLGGKSYCYARKIYRRFMKKYFLEGENERLVDTRELLAPLKIKKSSRIFVCSTYELFHPAADFARNEIFDTIKENRRHTFIVLTKMPERIDRPMPDNVWLGTSVTGMNDIDRISSLLHQKAKIKFISYEPLLEFPAIPAKGINWVIIGRLTQHGKRHDPPKRWIDQLVEMSHALKYPVFLKNNLRDIWGPNLIQEFPK